MKVSELEAAELDAAVAMAAGAPLRHSEDKQWVELRHGIAHWCTDDRNGQTFSVRQWKPSQDWQDGGPIIERERIVVYPLYAKDGNGWGALHDGFIQDAGSDEVLGGSNDHGEGATPLIAAMRAYVASKFGEEIELP